MILFQELFINLTVIGSFIVLAYVGAKLIYERITKGS